MNTCSSELQELLKTLYSLTPQESDILSYLCNKKARIKKIAKALGKNRSTIQRYVSSLQKAGLISRKSIPSKKGKGRYFVYYIKNKKELKDKIKKKLKDWKNEKLKEIEKI